ncbi:MAG: hypothetical protein IT361_07435 [Gemmatimonadaceae bacterium]|nr:hypothetical protein [Gemmatimonadaceae bacterium]
MPLNRLRSVRAGALPILCAAALGACRDAIPAWGPTLAEARLNANNAFAGFAVRFTNVQRDAKFAAARPIMGRYALTPARLYRDTSLWTIHHAPDSSQGLYLDATFDQGRYLFSARASAPYPRRLGDERHYIRLAKLGTGDYEWITIVDHGIGPVPAARVGDALGAFVTAFEGRSGVETLADMRGTFPRAARQLGRLFRVDSLRTMQLADGSTGLALSIRWQPDSMRRGSPAFAAWVDRYVMPTTWRLQVHDHGGVRYLDVIGGPGAITIHARARAGGLVALNGAPRPLPDSLRMTAEVSAKFRIFRVGFERLVGDVIIERSVHERGLMLRFRDEPEWHFPLAIRHLIRTPLRRPFEGRGTEMRLSVRDDLGTQTMSLRHIRTVVNESAIMRWLNGLGATAFGDFEGATEIEENRFLAAVFESLRRDVGDFRP